MKLHATPFPLLLRFSTPRFIVASSFIMSQRGIISMECCNEKTNFVTKRNDYIMENGYIMWKPWDEAIPGFLCKFEIIINATREKNITITIGGKLTPLLYYPHTTTCAKQKTVKCEQERTLSGKRCAVVGICYLIFALTLQLFERRRRLAAKKKYIYNLRRLWLTFPSCCTNKIIRFQFLHAVSLILEINIKTLLLLKSGKAIKVTPFNNRIFHRLNKNIFFSSHVAMFQYPRWMSKYLIAWRAIKQDINKNVQIHEQRQFEFFSRYLLIFGFFFCLYSHHPKYLPKSHIMKNS